MGSQQSSIPSADECRRLRDTAGKEFQEKQAIKDEAAKIQRQKADKKKDEKNRSDCVANILQAARRGKNYTKCAYMCPDGLEPFIAQNFSVTTGPAEQWEWTEWGIEPYTIVSWSDKAKPGHYEARPTSE